MLVPHAVNRFNALDSGAPGSRIRQDVRGPPFEDMGNLLKSIETRGFQLLSVGFQWFLLTSSVTTGRICRHVSG